VVAGELVDCGASVQARLPVMRIVMVDGYSSTWRAGGPAVMPLSVHARADQCSFQTILGGARNVPMCALVLRVFSEPLDADQDVG
jgi:hypothetical protein